MRLLDVISPPQKPKPTTPEVVENATTFVDVLPWIAVALIAAAAIVVTVLIILKKRKK